MKFYLSLLIVIILLTIAFIFGSQNEQTISLNYLIARTEISVAMAVSIFTSIGFLLGIMISLVWKFSSLLKRKTKRKLSSDRTLENSSQSKASI